jgi:CspA family cold shock protein
MKTGTVKFYNETKGFGFIIDDESKADLFVHATGLIDSIREDDRVEFEVKEGKKGPNAVNVKKVEG